MVLEIPPPIQNILHLYRKTSSCNLFPQADRQKLGALKSGIGILIGRVQEKGESQYHLCCFDKVNVFMDHPPPQCVPLEMRAGQLLHQRTRGVQERIVLDIGGCRKVETKRTEIIEPGGLIFPLKL